MSWWIYLNDPETGKPVHVGPHQEGATRSIPPDESAEINVTYNYGKFFRFPKLHKMKAQDTINWFEVFIEHFGTDVDDDYWKVTAGNIGHCLSILLKWAQQYPNAIWEVS